MNANLKSAVDHLDALLREVTEIRDRLLAMAAVQTSAPPPGSGIQKDARAEEIMHAMTGQKTRILFPELWKVRRKKSATPPESETYETWTIQEARQRNRGARGKASVQHRAH